MDAVPPAPPDAEDSVEGAGTSNTAAYRPCVGGWLRDAAMGNGACSCNHETQTDEESGKWPLLRIPAASSACTSERRVMIDDGPNQKSTQQPKCLFRCTGAAARLLHTPTYCADPAVARALLIASACASTTSASFASSPGNTNGAGVSEPEPGSGSLRNTRSAGSNSMPPGMGRARTGRSAKKLFVGMNRFEPVEVSRCHCERCT